MYDLGEGGDAFRFVAAVEARALLSRQRSDVPAGRDTEALRKLDADVVAGEKARSGGADAELHCAIVAISPLAIATSNLVQLVLTTASGVRIYLQTVPAAATNPKARPVHLRPLFALPPPRAADSKPLRCMRGSVLCAGEVTLLASGVDDSPQRGGVELLCLADLPLPSFERPAGSASSTSAAAERCALGRLRLQGAILAVAQETAGRAVDEPASYELVEQHAKPPRGYAVLTSDGVQRLRKRRPVDELLQSSQVTIPSLYAGLTSPVESFFLRYGADEGCAMCLLATLSHASDSALAAQLAGWASALGGDTLSLEQPAAAQPQQGQAATAQGQAIRLPSPRFSGRHGGICRVIARLLAPHWANTIVTEVPAAGAAPTGTVQSVASALGAGAKPPTAVEMRVASETWRGIQQSLLLLVAHLDAHPAQWGRSPSAEATPSGASGPSVGGAALRSTLYAGSAEALERRRGVEMAHAAAREAEAIEALVAFAKRAAEAAAFLATIALVSSGDGSGSAGHVEVPRQRLMQRLASRLEPALLTTLKKLTLAELIVPLQKDSAGRPLPGKWDATVDTKLPKALFMELGGADGGGALTAELQRHCPTFFSTADQAVLKGWSLLNRAATPSVAHDERASLLSQAMRTFSGVTAHVDLPKLLAAIVKQRSSLASAPAAAAATSVLDAGLAELPLAAARAADPSFAANALLIGGGGGGLSEWSTKLRGVLATRLRCYGLLLAKLELLAAPPPPASSGAAKDKGAAPKANGTSSASNGSAAAPSGAPAAAGVFERGGHGDSDAWLRVLTHALRVQPTDALFHHAVFLHLLHSKRDAVLLTLPSAHLLSFATSPPLTDAARQVWGRFLRLGPPEELASLESLLAAPVSPGWAAVEKILASGALLPRLHFDNGRFVEAALAFAELAERPEPGAPPPPAALDTPLAPVAATSQPAAPLSPSALLERQRALEVRISFISMALASASGAGGSAASGLGTDFVRTLEENAQRAQLQLKLASDLGTLLGSEARVQQLLPFVGGHADAASLRRSLEHFHAQVCGSLVELNGLFKATWAARLWAPLLAILDFARPYREYPQCVTVALQHILHQPPELWSGANGGVVGPSRPWGEISRDVASLRKAFSNDYIFQPDVIVACLEAHQLSQPRPEEGLVVRNLCSRAAATARPPVPWATIYQCYGSADRCGPLMKVLWEGQRSSLGSTGRQKLHLAAGLATLLAEWLDEARGPSADRGDLAAFAAAQRQLGVAADLDRHIAELDGIGALLGDNQLLASRADLLRQQLRRLLHDISSMGHL